MRKILVVEDMEGMQVAIGAYLKQLRTKFPHAEISFVSTLEDAWPILREIPPPDVVFLDLALPPFSWQETVLQIPAIEALCPVIVMTGYPADKVRAMMRRDDIDILEKGSSMFGKIWEYIARAISRHIRSDNMDRAAENIRILREMIPHHGAASQ